MVRLFPRRERGSRGTRTVFCCDRTRGLLNGFSIDVGGLCSTLRCTAPTGGRLGKRVCTLVKTLCYGLASCGGTVRVGRGTVSVFGSVKSSVSVTLYCGSHNVVRCSVGRFGATRRFLGRTLVVGHDRGGLEKVSTGLGGLYLCRNSFGRGLDLVGRTVVVGGGLGSR